MIQNTSNLPSQKNKRKEGKKPRNRINRGGIHVRKMTNYYDCKHDLQEKFRQFNKQQKRKNVKDTFLSMLGKHNPIHYDKLYGFKEQWQMTHSEQQSRQYKSHQAYTILSAFRMLLLGFCIWSLSTALFFPIQENMWVKIVLLTLYSIETAKFFATYQYLVRRQKIIQFVQLFIAFLYGISIFIFSVVQIQSFYSRIIGIIIIIQMYFRLSKIYSSFKNYHISSNYRDSINLFDLFALLIGITHIFGCVLYTTCELSPSQNWAIKAQIQDKQWAEKYIYSLYFSATTLLTVGYGDLAPTNVPQIIAILVTQFIGIAIFGYTVNKIGAALSKMQQKSQKVHKDLGTVEKFGKNCRLQPDVICKMRTEVINNKQLDQDLCVQDENQLIKKFSEDLRQKIQIQSCTKVIKRSVFMILNWTGGFQYKIARRLVKQVYKPQQILPQYPGKEKLYILDSGKIEVLNQSRSNYIQKVLKTFCVQKESEIAVQNIYGYSAIISSRPLNLYAIARQTSICYTLSKVEFLKILDQCQVDKQHYHEIKAKIQFSKIQQQIQFPKIADIRHHYLPSVHFIVAKNKKLKGKCQNSRTKYSRKQKKTKLCISDRRSASIQHRYSQLAQSCLKDLEKSKHRKAEQSKTSMLSTQQNFQFQITKSYERFFKKSNMQNIVLKLKNINFIKKLSKVKQN